jgi:hypothetical protein
MAQSVQGCRTAELEFAFRSDGAVEPSGHYMYRTVVTICTTSLTFNNSTFCPHGVFLCFVWIWEQTAIISLYNINCLVVLRRSLWRRKLQTMSFFRLSVCLSVCDLVLSNMCSPDFPKLAAEAVYSCYRKNVGFVYIGQLKSILYFGM